MDPEINEQSHEHIFQIYKELKSILPKDILKIKVLKNQRYPIIRNSLMKEIENDIINKNKNYSSQKINIFFNEDFQKKDKIQNMAKINKVNIITYHNFREKNMKISGANCDFKLKRNKGMYNSFSVNDYDLKKNIYLPRIIDRMKYNIPRNMRNNQGLLVVGINAKNLFNKEKEMALKRKKENLDDFLYSKLRKINNKNEISNRNKDNNKVINNSSDKMEINQIIKDKY
jgi:hypothetical protein